MSYHANVLKETEVNVNFRRVLCTGLKSQLVVMSIPPGGEVGEETHQYTEQTLFVLSGSGEGEFDGKKFKPYSGASSSNTWEYDGKYIQPYSGANSSNKWEVTSTQVKPYSGANSSNTYDRNNQPIVVIIAKVIGLF